MKNTKKFFVVVTSLMLVFAMIGCPNSTSSGGSNTPIPSYPQNPSGPGGPYVTNEDELRIALTTSTGNPVYVVGEVTLTAPLVVPEGQSIVVTRDANTDNGTVVQSAGGLGPLFALVHGNGKLNIAYNLTLRNKASLTVNEGAAVAVKTPANPTELLTVQEGATVNVKTSSGLTIEPKAEAHFEKGAILAVVNEPSVVVVEKSNNDSAYGLLTIDEGLKVVVTKTEESEKVALYAESEDGDTKPIIEIPTGVAAAKISDDVTVYSTTEETEVATVVEAIIDENADAYKDGEATSDVKEQVEEAVAANPDKTTSDVTKLEDLLAATDTVTKTVTYTGTDALTGITIPTGKKLIIKGAVTNQADAIGGPGTLEITGSVETASSGVTPAALASLVKASGGGKVVLNSDVSVTGKLEVNLTLEIAAGATLALGTTGNINLLDADGNITGTIVNKGTISTEQDDINGKGLGEFLALVGGTFEVKGAGGIDVDEDDTLAIPTGVTLKLSGSATLTNEGTITFDAGSGLEVDGGTIVNDGATIKTADADVLASLLGSVMAGEIEVTDSIALTATATLKNSATLKVTATKTLNVSGSLDVKNGATITAAGDTESGTITGDVTQVVTGIELSDAEGANPDDLDIDSVKRDLTTAKYGIVTITLKGNAGTEIPSSEDENSVYYDLFGDDFNDIIDSEKAEQGYSAVVIAGLLTYAETGKIKQSNRAFNMWDEDYVDGGFTGYGEDHVYKEKVYTASGYYPEAIGGFDILLWSGAKDTPIKLEITQPYSDDGESSNDGQTKTFLIDFSTVTFTD